MQVALLECRRNVSGGVRGLEGDSGDAEAPLWCGGGGVRRGQPGPRALLSMRTRPDGWDMACLDAKCGSSCGGSRRWRVPHACRRVDPDDLARLNSVLNADLRFEVDSGEPGGQGTASGTLVCEPSPGRRRTATYPIMLSRERRKLLRSLSRSLAECAMALGLGAGVYGERSPAGSADRGSRLGGERRGHYPPAE